MEGEIGTFRTRKQKTQFYLIITLSLILIFSTRYIFIPLLIKEPISGFVEICKHLLEDVFVSLLVTIAIGLYIFWLTPRNKLKARMDILQPIEIRESLIKARNETDIWWFNGGSGRYTRTVTLPNLAQLSRNLNKTIDITVQIMNPANIELCKRYAIYRNSLRSKRNGSENTVSNVRHELYATILSVYCWKSDQSLLNVNIGLKDSFSLFRTDLSSNSAIITKEDPIEPAIIYERGTFFYKAQLEDLRQSFQQSKILDNRIVSKPLGQLVENDIKILLEGLNIADGLISDDYKTILQIATQNVNPYD